MHILTCLLCHNKTLDLVENIDYKTLKSDKVAQNNYSRTSMARTPLEP